LALAICSLKNQNPAMGTHPPEFRLVHPLPMAPQFVGREDELAELRALWLDSTPGVVALVGLGGAGKTAIAGRFLDELSRSVEAPRPVGLFVWSFYQEPDVGLFLQELLQYFRHPDSSSAPAKGAGLLHLLREALSSGDPHLLVLDGLERVQRQEEHVAGSFGQIEDPLLKGLLLRIAEGIGRTFALVTSRFPLTELRPMLGRGYCHIDVEGLSLPAASALLRSHGVTGDDTALARLVEAYGAHALTLDHLGALIGQFLGGDPGRAPEAPELTSPQQDRQALRLARLLNAYEEHLPPAELALLCRLCLLERSAKIDQILPLFLCSPAVHLRTAREIEELIRHIAVADQIVGRFKPELSESIREVITDALQQAPIAGPDQVFKESVRTGITSLLEEHATNVENDVDELLHLYDITNFEVTTEQRPLSWQDQKRLRELVARHNELRLHPLLPFMQPPKPLAAILEESWGKPSKESYADLNPDDVLRAYRRVKQDLQRFAVKHLALRRVREICRLYQQKWQASGVLANLDATTLRQAVESLVARHLALREDDGSITVHPAVRDYFGQRAAAADQGFWHHLIGEQLISLVRRPGLRLPTDQASLDLVEDAIGHAIRAGQTEKALKLYTQVLGGHRHLAWKLGDMARGLRIIRAFNPCPDRWALGWYLRALGELEAAFEQHTFPFFRADIRLLQGRLTEVEKEGDPARTAVASFLMAQTTRVPSDTLGCAIPRVQLLLYMGRYADAWNSTQSEQLYEMIGWEDNRALCQLLRADAAARIGDTFGMRQSLESAAPWVLHSGSVEHLCLYHLVRARSALRSGERSSAQLDVDEGLHIARQCGLGLYHVELTCVLAEMLLAEADAVAAEHAAREAMQLAAPSGCHFVWGFAEAGHLLGQALAQQGQLEEAALALEEIKSLRMQIGDVRAAQTDSLIKAIKR
jgi:tetratricopeptide (TPR) repeat protein